MDEPRENFDDYGERDGGKNNDYGKHGAHLMNTSDKEVSKGHLEMNRGGRGDSGENNGPTGSSRHYGKKAPGATHPDKTDWNPIKGKPSTYGLEGCG
jgi:hypothetical protein